jgi:hypothetical protein
MTILTVSEGCGNNEPDSRRKWCLTALQSDYMNPSSPDEVREPAETMMRYYPPTEKTPTADKVLFDLPRTSAQRKNNRSTTAVGHTHPIVDEQLVPWPDYLAVRQPTWKLMANWL